MTKLISRIRFYAIEIARNKEEINDKMKNKQETCLFRVVFQNIRARKNRQKKKKKPAKNSIHENFRVNAPAQKGNFQKGISMCHLLSLFFSSSFSTNLS